MFSMLRLVQLKHIVNCEKYRITDIVTHEIFEELLEDEVGDEEEWEKLGANM
jgi:hypothetical protein